MATTTPNYLWSVPTSSDLVKNGATAIETLGDSADQSLWNSGYGQAGKNKIINGDFGVWQRGTSFTQADTYCADRWTATYGGASPTAAAITRQSFTPATAPVAGYESTYFLRMVTTTIGSCTAAGFEQRIEDVRTYAGQTATISFWAKADAARSAVVVTRQNFGSGGSTATYVEAATVSLTTSWTRFTVSYAVPSISGKTVGTGSYLSFGLRMTTMANGGTMDLWGYQAEYGSYATPFQTASGGSPQGELAMCQRYYWRLTPPSACTICAGFVDGTTFAIFNINLPVTMRTAPTALEQSGTASDYGVRQSGGVVTALSSVPTLGVCTNTTASLSFTVASGLTAGQGVAARLVNANAYLGWTAEL